MLPKHPRVIDLTHPMTPDMPVYPGTEPPLFETGTTIAADGFAEKKLTLFSHTGTHLDAPAHILEHAPDLDALDAARFVGPSRLLDLRELADPARISAADIRPHLNALRGLSFALLRTGWERHWGQPSYFEGFPVLDEEAAGLLADAGLSGVGVDAVSVDAISEPEVFPVHRIFFGRSMVVVENLTNLGALPDGEFLFSALPLRIASGDGSPVRAVALVEDVQDPERPASF